LNDQQEKLLVAMGVRVWHARRRAVSESESAPAVGLSPAKDVLLTERHQPAAALPGTPAMTKRRAEKTAAAARSPDAVEPDPVVFSWMKGATGMIVCSSNLDAKMVQMMRDILTYADWLQGEPRPSFHQGEFRWPQLTGTTAGTPARSLSVFVHKHLTHQRAWLGLTPELHAGLEGWLEELPVALIQLPSIQSSLSDPGLKQAIWASLNQRG